MAYGVTTTTLGGYAHGLTFSATTKPTTTQAQAVIDFWTLAWDKIAESKGFTAATVQADTGHALYNLGQQWISCRAAAQLLEAREKRESTITRSLRMQADTIMPMPGSLVELVMGDDFSTANGKPTAWASAATVPLTTAQESARSLWEAMQDDGEL